MTAAPFLRLPDMMATWLARRQTLVAVLVGAAVLRLGTFLVWQPIFTITAGNDMHGSMAYDLYARNLIATGIYGLTPGVADAVLPPLFSAALAAVYSMAARHAVFVVIFNTVADLITILAVSRLGARLFGPGGAGAAVGTVAAACVAFYPYLVFQSLTVNDTAMFVALLYTFVVLIVALRDVRPAGRTAGLSLLCGIVAGLATLTRPVIAPIVLMAAGWLVASVGFRTTLRRLLPAAVAGTIVVAPWLVRNATTIGTTALTTNGGSNFWQGNNPETVPYLRAGYDVQWIPSEPTGAQDTLGPEADRVMFQRAVRYLTSHPEDIPSLIWTKFRIQWSIDITPRLNPAPGAGDAAGAVAPVSRDGALALSGLRPDDPIAAYSQPLFDRVGRTVHRFYWGSLLILGVVGIVQSAKRWRDVSIVLAVPVALTLVYVAIHPSTRYRAPGDPAWFLFAGAAVVAGLRRRADRARLQSGDATSAPAFNPDRRLACAWIGTARYSRPLDDGTDRKWRALATIGADMHVIGFAMDGRPVRFTQSASFHLLPAVRIAAVRHATMMLAGPCLLGWIAVRHRVRVVFAQSPIEGAPAAVVVALLRWCGRPVSLVVESHGDFTRSIFLQRPTPLSRLYRPLIRWCAAFALRRADHGRAVSHATREQMRALAPHLETTVFPTWVDMATFTTPDRDIPPSRSNVVFFAGALIPRKGVHVLIEAFADLTASADARLVIAGPPDNPAYATGLQSQVRRLGLDDRVQLAGPLPPPALRDWFDAARVLVLPSMSEGLARVLLEAMLRGTPVVATDVDGARDIVVDGDTGYLVPPGDPRALASALRRVFQQPDIDLMGARALDRARRTVSVDGYVGGHRRIIQTLTSVR